MISAEHRDFIERSITETAALLAEPQAEAFLGDYTAQLRQTVEGLFIPNIDHYGVVTIPRNYQDTDCTPVLVQPKHTLRTGGDFARLTPRQRTALEQRLASLVGTEQIESQLHDLEHSLQRPGYEDLTRQSITPAWVGSRHTLRTLQSGELGTTEQQKMHLFGRPYMGLMPPLMGAKLVSPVTMLHEMVHIEQCTTTPLVLLPPTLDAADLFAYGNELVGYHVGARGSELAYETDNAAVRNDPWKSDALQRKIEAARLAHNPPEQPLAIDQELITKIFAIVAEWDSIVP